MNITLRCRGSKREQARPPIRAARRQAHRRAGCRGDQTNAALNARVRPNRPHDYRCRGSCSCRPCQAGDALPRRAAGAFFSVSWASWASTTSPSNAPSSLSRVDAVERKPCAQLSPPGPVSQPMIRSALFSVLSDIGTPSSLDLQQIADQRRAISAFGVGLALSATESTPEVVQHEVSVSLGIVGHNGWVRMTRPSLGLAILR
jgi:hypothetical protein